ncbi:hypothetical protein [Pyxidicoccus fallax]|nr:hypothetical protein [Pyxidicoccus fallax]
MKRTRLAALTLALLPVVAGAQSTREERREARAAERLEQREQRQRLRQVLELSAALELDNAQALKMEQTLRTFDEKRRPLREQVRDAARILMLAARGDNAALPQVDAAAQRAFEARERIAVLDREMYQALARELPPEKRARLALTLARTEGKMKLKWKRQLADPGTDE